MADKNFDSNYPIEEIFNTPEPNIFGFVDDAVDYEDTLLAMYDTKNPDVGLLDLIDGEITRLGGAPVTIYKYLGYSNADPLYEEERDKAFYRPAIKAIAHYVPPGPIQENMSEFGMELTSDLTFIFNKTYIENTMGERIKPGDVIKPDFINMYYKIYEVQEESFEAYGVYKLRATAKVWRASGKELIERVTTDDSDIMAATKIREELNQVITYSDGYRAFFDVRYPIRIRQRDRYQEGGGFSMVFLGHGGGGGRYMTASKGRWLSELMDAMTITFDIRGQGESLDLLNDKDIYGRQGPFSIREIMDVQELMETVIKKYTFPGPVDSPLTALGRPFVDANYIAWSGFSQGGVYAMLAAAQSGQKIPPQVVDLGTGWIKPGTDPPRPWTKEDEGRRVAVVNIAGIPPTLSNLAVGRGFVFNQTFARQQYHTNTPDWQLYPGGPGYPPFDPTEHTNRCIWNYPLQWRQYTNLATRRVIPEPGGGLIPEPLTPPTWGMNDILNMAAMWEYFTGRFTGDVGTPEPSQTSYFVDEKYIFDKLVTTDTFLGWQLDPEDLFCSPDPLFGLMYKRSKVHSTRSGSPRSPGKMLVRIGMPAHGADNVTAEGARYGGMERALLGIHLKQGIRIPKWLSNPPYARESGLNIGANTLLVKVKPNVQQQDDVLIQNRRFGYLYGTDGKDWKYVISDIRAIKQDQGTYLNDDVNGDPRPVESFTLDAMGYFPWDQDPDAVPPPEYVPKVTRKPLYCVQANRGGAQPGQTLNRTPNTDLTDHPPPDLPNNPADQGRQYNVHNNVAEGFDIEAYINIAKLPSYKLPNGRLTENFGPSQLLTKNLIGNINDPVQYQEGELLNDTLRYDTANFWEYTSDFHSEGENGFGGKLLWGPVTMMVTAWANGPFMLAASLYSVYTTQQGQNREIFITCGYCHQPDPNEALLKRTYVFNLGAECFPLQTGHRLRLKVETFPWQRYANRTTARSAGGVFKPGMYFRNFNATIKERVDSQKDPGDLEREVYWYDQRDVITGVNSGDEDHRRAFGADNMAADSPIFANMNINIPLLPDEFAVQLADPDAQDVFEDHSINGYPDWDFF